MFFITLLGLALSATCPDPIEQINMTGDDTYTGCTFSTFNDKLFISDIPVALTCTSCTFKDISLKSSSSSAVIYLNDNDDKTVTIEKCKFENCQNTGKYGAGIYVNVSKDDANGKVYVKETEFTKMFADNSGSAVYCDKPYVEVSNCKFTECSQNSKTSDGGIVVVSGESSKTNLGFRIADCIFESNKNNTGAINPKAAINEIANCVFSGFQLDGNVGKSLIKATAVCTISITNCSFFDNIQNASNIGGSSIYFNKNTTITVKDCQFSNGEKGSDINIASTESYCNFENCTFTKSAKEPTIIFTNSKGMAGSLTFTKCNFINKNTESKSPYYIKITQKSIEQGIKINVDGTNKVDVSKEDFISQLSGTESSYNLNDAAFQGAKQSEAPPEPVITNPPQPETCPNKTPFNIDADYDFSNCNYTTGGRIFGIFSNDPSLRVQDCSFANLEATTGFNGGSVILTYKNDAKLIEFKRCTFINCKTEGQYGGILQMEFKEPVRCPLFVFEQCTVKKTSSKERGAAIFGKGIDVSKITGSSFEECQTEDVTKEGGVLNFSPKASTFGPGTLTITDCTFAKNNRCILAKIDEVNVIKTKFNECYHDDNYETGAAICVPEKAFGTNLLVDLCAFTKCGFSTGTSGGIGGAIYNGDLNSVKVTNCNFDQCITKTGGSINVKNCTNDVTIHHNVFTNGCGDLCFKNGCHGVISNNAFDRHMFRSAFYGENVTFRFTRNCFKNSYEKDDGKTIYIIAYSELSDITIDSDNCFDNTRERSVEVASKKLKDSDNVYICKECPNLDESSVESTPKNGLPKTTMIGIIVAVIVVVVVVIIILVIYIIKRKPKDGSDNGDYGNVPESQELNGDAL